MTTQEALNKIGTFITGYTDDANYKLGIAEGLGVAIDQLNGILNTPPADLVAEKEKVALLDSEKVALQQTVSERDQEISNYKGQIDILNARIAELEAQLTENNEVIN